MHLYRCIAHIMLTLLFPLLVLVVTLVGASCGVVAAATSVVPLSKP